MTQETPETGGDTPSFAADAAAPPPAPEGNVGEAAIREAIAGAQGFDMHQADVFMLKEDEHDLTCARYLLNDVGNARRLMTRFGKDLMYVRELGWLAWTGTHWSRQDGPRLAHRFAHRTALKIFDEAKALLEAPLRKGETEQKRDKAANMLKAWAIKTGNAGKVASMLGEAAPYLTRKVEELDRNVYLFNCAGGTVDLKDIAAGQRPHRREDCITKISPGHYTNKETPKHFLQFLRTVQPNEEVQLFLQKYFGYALSGDTSAQCLVLLHGTGSNGKSTLMDTFNYVMGDYAMNVPFASLLYDERKRGGEASPDLARLPGARMVCASEPEVGARFSESLLKSLTGGEKITARHLNQDFFEFKPQFKLALAFNNKPSVRGQDDGIWRRLIMVPFEVVIPPEKRDRELPEKLRAEADAILGWLIDGAAIWLEEGLRPPQVIMDATQEYRVENDAVGQFIDNTTLRKQGSNITAKKLYGVYKQWCEENAINPMTQTGFGKRLSDRGIKKMRCGNVYYMDIELLAAYENYGGGGGE